MLICESVFRNKRDRVLKETHFSLKKIEKPGNIVSLRILQEDIDYCMGKLLND